MAESTAGRPATPLAVVGLACRFPDADDPAGLLDVVVTGRKCFRRLPPGRLDLADYYQPDLATLDATYCTRAALIEGWQFDCTAFGIEAAAYTAADLTHWLALETTARALAAAGLPAGSGINRDRTGVIIGNTLAGDTSRANGLRVRWPFVRRVLTEALRADEIPPSQAGELLRRTESGYLAPFPPMGPDSLAGSMPATIAAAISSYFGFRGGSHVVDSACSSSLQAVASACTALVAGELDVAIAGGVDLSIDPLELIGLARARVLATTDVRIYDQNPTGYLPGEGCGVVVLMRAADARAAGLPVYAEIMGWGTSAGATPGEPLSNASSQLLAMQRAYERSGVDPADIQFIEGNGAGTPADDEAELTALCELRTDARQLAALGSVKANIGHAQAAAGAAGLIKTVLAVSTGVVPPASGVDQPHPLISGGDARIRLPQAAEEWEAGTRLAAVSTMGIGGSNVHVVLRHEPASRVRAERWLRSVQMLARPAGKTAPDPVQPPPAGQQPLPFLLHAPDRFALAAVLTRLADIAGSLSDGEMQDLACLLGRDTAKQGPAKVGLVATRQEQLAVLAREAVTMLPRLSDGVVMVRPGIFAADDADGRVTLLLSGAGVAGRATASAANEVTAAVSQCLDTIRWLESMDVQAAGAVGHGLGALAGLAWAGVLGESEVVDIAELRAQFLRRSGEGDGAGAATGQESATEQGVDEGTDDGPAHTASGRMDSDALRAAIAQRFRFGPPRRRLIPTSTGAEVSSVTEAIDLICGGFSGADKLAEAIGVGAIGATLLLETGPGRQLALAAAEVSRAPAVSLQSGFADPMNRARAAAALFAAGALGQPQPLFAGTPARPIDIWRDQIFITNPCQVSPQQKEATPPEPTAELSAAPSDEPAAAQHADRRAVEDDGISGRRTEFERRLPPRALIEAAAAAVGPTDTVQAGESEPGTPAPEEPMRPAEPAQSAAQAEPAQSAAQAEPAQSAAQAEPAQSVAEAVSQPVPAAPAKPAKPVVAAELAATKAVRNVASDPLAMPGSEPTGATDGVRPWARCFAEELRPAQSPAVPEVARAWRIHAATSNPMLADLSALFTADPAADRTLAIIGDPADDRSRLAALEAARDALSTGALVVLTTSAGFTGFFASVHAEHPSIGITVLRMPEGARVPAVALQFAHADPAVFRELVIGPNGSVCESVPTQLELGGGGASPVGTDDVVLVSRDSGGAGLVLAQVLALCGAAVAVIGRTGDNDDSELVANLEHLRSAGARIGYEIIDITDPASLTAAVRRIEDRLGPVTAIGHSGGPEVSVPLHDLTDAQVGRNVADQAETLDRLVSSVRPGQLKLIVTFGSLAGRYGMAGAALAALGSGALAERARQLSRASAGCRAVHIDMPPLSTPGLGDRAGLADELGAAGIAPLELSVASRLLLKIMTTPDVPADLAVHGRAAGLASWPAPAVTDEQLAAAGLPTGGRFLRDAVVHYPGIEFVCAARLSLASDPYLADYRIDGMPVLPPALAIEALAQVASVLAGRPVRLARQVTMESPVAIPSSGEAAIRLCAMREGNVITAVLRCAESHYRTDHATAEFSLAPDQDWTPAAGLLGAASTAAASTAAAASAASPAATTTASTAAKPPNSSPSLVDGAELYGPVFFQSGRFRRIAFLSELTARSGRALARGTDDDQPWFAADGGLAATGVLLGNPGLNDAMLQVLQACVPHRRVRPASCESVQFSGLDSAGAVQITAIATGSARTAAAPVHARAARPLRARVPGQAPPPAAEMPTGAARRPVDMTRQELADMEIVERRPLSRKARKRRLPQHASPDRQRRLAAPLYSAFHTWEVAAEPTRVPEPAHDAPAARRAARSAHNGTPEREPVLVTSLNDDQQRWDVEAVDASGQLLAAWHGVQLRDCGPLPRNAAWPPTLLSVFLERGAVELGLDSTLQVSVSCTRPDGESMPRAAATPLHVPLPEAASPDATQSVEATGQPAWVPHVSTVPGVGPLAGFRLTARATEPVACAWTVVDGGHRQHPGASFATIYAQLRAELSESPAILAARLEAIGVCLAAAGASAASRNHATIRRTTTDGWVLLELDYAWVACAVVELSGVSGPVALAILTGSAASFEAELTAGAAVTAWRRS